MCVTRSFSALDRGGMRAPPRGSCAPAAAAPWGGQPRCGHDSRRSWRLRPVALARGAGGAVSPTLAVRDANSQQSEEQTTFRYKRREPRSSIPNEK